MEWSLECFLGVSGHQPVAVLGLHFFVTFHIPLADITIMSETGEKPMKAGPSHPTYLQMILDAITEIGNPKGSSR